MSDVAILPRGSRENNAIRFVIGFAQQWASEWGGHSNKQINQAAEDVNAQATIAREWLRKLEEGDGRSLDQLVEEIFAWQQATFPDGTEGGRIAHWQEEIKEYLADPSSGEEAADVFLLFVAVFKHHDIDLRAEVERKLEINRGRVFAKVAGGYSKHVKEKNHE